jgi:hypothetical protein
VSTIAGAPTSAHAMMAVVYYLSRALDVARSLALYPLNIYQAYMHDSGSKRRRAQQDVPAIKTTAPGKKGRRRTQ